MAKLPFDATDYGLRNKKISDRVAIVDRDDPTNLLANTIRDSLKKSIYKDDDSAEALVVRIMPTETSKFYHTNPILKDENIANRNTLYKCVVINDPSCQIMPKIQSDTDSIIDIPGATMIFAVAPGISAVLPGNLVRVRFNNRDTSHLTIAGIIEEVVNEGLNWERFGVNCAATIPAAKDASAEGTQSTTVGKCVSTRGGTKKVVTAYRPAASIPDRDVEYPRNPQKGAPAAPNNLPKLTNGKGSKFGPRNLALADASKFHGGVDIVAANGDPVYAALDGEIAVRAQGGTGATGYGYYVVVKHTKYKTNAADNIFYTLYGHLKPDCLKYPKTFSPGTTIGRGQLIGHVGHKIGSSTGPHLHFSVMYSHKKGWQPGDVATKADIVDPMSDFFNNKFEKLK